MIDKMLLNPKVVSALIERVHEDSLPITIEIGYKKNGMISVLVECDDEDLFGRVLDETINEIFGV